jgi:hypothetical protein
MIYGIVLFSFLSFVFSSPRWRWLISADMSLSLKEEKAGLLFGRYMRDAAAVMLLLWLLRTLNHPWVYVAAGCVFFLRTLGFLIHMAQVFIKD